MMLGNIGQEEYRLINSPLDELLVGLGDAEAREVEKKRAYARHTSYTARLVAEKLGKMQDVNFTFKDKLSGKTRTEEYTAYIYREKNLLGEKFSIHYIPSTLHYDTLLLVYANKKLVFGLGESEGKYATSFPPIKYYTPQERAGNEWETHLKELATPLTLKEFLDSAIPETRASMLEQLQGQKDQ